MNVKNRIKTLREQSDISQTELAERLGVSQQKISQLENQRANPSAEEIVKLMYILNCSFDDLLSNEGEPNESTSKHLLITYKYREDHADPNFTKLAYGDSGIRASRIKNVFLKNDNFEPGSYVFFHTTIGESRYITAYYYVKQILEKGKDDAAIANLKVDAEFDDLIIIGDREKSKVLSSPLIFDKKLALELHSLGFSEDKFESTPSELKVISDKTRNHTLLSNNDVSILLNKCNKRG